MTDQLLLIACLSLALVSALIGGVFQSFSDFVMQGLGSAPPDGGMASMQGINVTVFKSWFLRGFIVLVPVSLVLALWAVVMLPGAISIALVLASASLLLGGLGVTMFGNVPMNEKLADLPLDTPESHAYWQHYLQVWTRWNHVRTFACIATAACYLYAAFVLAGQVN